MKKFISYFLSVITFFINGKIFSQGSLEVFTQNGEKFWLIINGIKQNETPKTNVKVTNLKDPNYTVKVIFEEENIPSIDQNVFVKDVDGNYANLSYIIKKNKKGEYVMKISSYSEARSDQNQFSTQLILNNTTSSSNNNLSPSSNVNTSQGMNVQMENSNIGVNININAPLPTINVTTTTTSSINTTQMPPSNQPESRPTPVLPGYSGPIGCPYPMNDSEFEEVKKSISSKTFEDSRLTIAKQIVENNCLLTTQVKEILKLFKFEDSKLQIAKLAYKKTYDKGNYYKINDVFSFESSIDELNEFINSQK